MATHAVIATGGKQVRVQVGDIISIEKLLQNQGDKVTFPVLSIENEADLKLGKPVLQGASVTGEVVEQKKDKKVIAYTYRKRKGSERKVGHRQPLTVIKITDIKG